MEIDVLGQKCLCLLDTGCDHSLIARRLVPTAILQPVDIDIWAANGTNISILGTMRFHFSVQGMEMTADLLVSDDVLGYDWLVNQRARWHFDEKYLF